MNCFASLLLTYMTWAYAADSWLAVADSLTEMGTESGIATP